MAISITEKENKEQWSIDGGIEIALDFDFINSNSIVMDIGGYRGFWSNEMAKRYSPHKLFVFEPVWEFCQQCNDLLGRYKFAKVLPFGLGAYSRVQSIGIMNDSTSIFLECTQHKSAIQIIRINDAMNSLGIDYSDLTAINIEGMEYELLEYLLLTGYIKQHRALLIQFHDMENKYGLSGYQERMRNIRKSLAKTHRCVYSYKYVFELWREEISK